MTQGPNEKNKRRSIRFAPDAGTFAKIDLQASRLDGAFQPSVVALVAEESAKGAGIVVLNIPGLQKGDICRIQVGQLSPLQAEVRWRKEIDPDVIRVGLQFLE